MKWTCTDPDTKQYGRQLSFTKFEFKERRDNQIFRGIIDLSDYSTEFIEGVISSYGYTLEEINTPSFPNIYNMYGKEALWIISECLFEQTT